jgi:hypothetical protein
MPSKHVADAVDARLADNWTATPIIDYDEKTHPPDDADGFLVVQYPISDGARPVFDRLFWEEGAIRLVLSVKRGVGKSQGLAWSDTLCHMFRAVKFDGIQTFEPDGPIIDDATYDGNWIIYAIIVPYRFEFEEAVFEFESA